MINIDKWLNSATARLHKDFCDKILFIGLQGSYGRGEATPESDIDLVVILNKMDFEDLKLYRSIIDSLPHRDKACGFISGRDELQKWSKADLFQFFYDTKALYGKLSDIIKPPSKEDIKKSIKSSSENLYHSAVHSFVHSNDYTADLQNLYKMTFFILQAKYFIETENYIKTKKELLEVLSDKDNEILNICINKEYIGTKDFAPETLYKKLIEWCFENI